MTDGELKKRKDVILKTHLTSHYSKKIGIDKDFNFLFDGAKQDFPDLEKKKADEEAEGIFGTWSGDEWGDFYDEIEEWFKRWFGDDSS